MSSPVVVQPESLGIQRPRCWSVPTYVSTSGPEIIELSAMAGLYLDEWQQFTLSESLGERPDGKWSAFEVGLMVSRQNGKGGLLEARELGGLFVLGERLIIHSAHQFDTSLEHFRRILGLIEETPELSKRIKRVSNAHGNEGIELKSGQRIRFRTRTKGGGRGFTGDLLVLDEAMDIPEATHGALVPTLSARPNPQIWYTGSAVDQEIDDNGVVFARIRERGLSGDDPALAYFEWSAAGEIDKVTPDFVRDRANWATANPALGIRISAEHVGHEVLSLSMRKFAVERLGVGDWPRTDDISTRVLDPDKWTACEDPDSQVKNPVCFAVDITPDRSSACISIAGDRADGKQHIEVLDNDRGTGWVVERVAELVKKWKAYAVVIDPGGPAGSLESQITDAVGMDASGRSLAMIITSREYAQACGVFYDAVDQRTLRHLGDDELDAAVDGAKTRKLGEAWAWDRKSSDIDISPLVSCTLALFGNSRRPKTKSRVINLNDI